MNKKIFVLFLVVLVVFSIGLISSSECSLTNDQKLNLSSELRKDGVVLSTNELQAYIDQFNKNEVEEVQISESTADVYDLYKATLTILENPLTITPKKLTPLFLVFNKNSKFSMITYSNKILSDVKLISGELGLSVEKTSDTTATIRYEIQMLDFTAKTIKGTINYISEDGESTFKDVEIKAFYPFSQSFILIVVILIGGITLFVVAKSRKVF